MKAGYKSKLSQNKSGVPALDACVVRAGIRDHVVQSVELKFNCFFLMPIVDAFPTRLRTDLEAAYEEDLDDVFDVAAVRAALEGRLRSLETELHQVSQLSHLWLTWSPPAAFSKALLQWDCHWASEKALSACNLVLSVSGDSGPRSLSVPPHLSPS